MKNYISGVGQKQTIKVKCDICGRDEKRCQKRERNVCWSCRQKLNQARARKRTGLKEYKKIK